MIILYRTLLLAPVYGPGPQITAPYKANVIECIRCLCRNVGDVKKGPTWMFTPKAEHQDTGAVRAIKAINRHKISDPARFQVEVDIQSSLDHPHHDRIFVVAGTIYINGSPKTISGRPKCLVMGFRNDQQQIDKRGSYNVRISRE